MDNKPSEQPNGDQMIEMQFQLLIGCFTRGVIGSFPNLPAQYVMPKLAKMFGHVMMSSMAGDVSARQKIRHEMLKAYGDAMRAVPLVETAPPGAPSPPRPMKTVNGNAASSSGDNDQ